MPQCSQHQQPHAMIWDPINIKSCRRTTTVRVCFDTTWWKPWSTNSHYQQITVAPKSTRTIIRYCGSNRSLRRLIGIVIHNFTPDLRPSAAAGYSSWPPLPVEAAFPFRLAMPEGSRRGSIGGAALVAGSTASIFHGGHDEILQSAAPILLRHGPACQKHARLPRRCGRVQLGL